MLLAISQDEHWIEATQVYVIILTSFSLHYLNANMGVSNIMHQDFEGKLFIHILIIIVLHCIVCFVTHNKNCRPLIIKLSIYTPS